MLNKFIKNALLASFLLISPFAIAQSVQCPNPKEIKDIPFSTIQKGDHPDVWTLIQINQYKTPYKWQFSLMVEAKNQNEAIKKAKKALTKLRKIRGPKKEDLVWVCDYQAPATLMAIATTSP
jgi:hypothetical protein